MTDHTQKTRPAARLIPTASRSSRAICRLPSGVPVCLFFLPGSDIGRTVSTFELRSQCVKPASMLKAVLKGHALRERGIETARISLPRSHCGLPPEAFRPLPGNGRCLQQCSERTIALRICKGSLTLATRNHTGDLVNRANCRSVGRGCRRIPKCCAAACRLSRCNP